MVAQKVNPASAMPAPKAEVEPGMADQGRPYSTLSHLLRLLLGSLRVL